MTVLAGLRCVDAALRWVAAVFDASCRLGLDIVDVARHPDGTHR